MLRSWLGACGVVLLLLAVSGDLAAERELDEAAVPATRVGIGHDGGAFSVHHRLRGLHFALDVRPHRFPPVYGALDEFAAFTAHLQIRKENASNLAPVKFLWMKVTMGMEGKEPGSYEGQVESWTVVSSKPWDHYTSVLFPTAGMVEGTYTIKIQFEASSLWFKDGASFWRPEALRDKLWVSVPIRFVEPREDDALRQQRKKEEAPLDLPQICASPGKWDQPPVGK
eukprot:CAMPEP_0180192384 /NCGR_PEP_ID=MMETSP0987-20121128/1951_1 /TAXON_ID=697907 /ORGANISM="non described non described, Strain CCMP2293" /LENGTH=225 /DNA_ID=CAMNT_0022147007 /DNA_START=1 /DNA_END=675 /DNA_ORIENTATION=-